MLSAPESLQHADAVNRLLDGGGEVTGLVLAAAGDDRVLLFEYVAVDPQRNRRHDEDDPEHPRDVDEEDEPDNDREHVHDEQHQTEGQPAADEVQIADGSRQQLATGPPIVETHGQMLQRHVERIAHARFDMCSRREHEVATQRNHDRFDNAETQNDTESRPNLARVP